MLAASVPCFIDWPKERNLTTKGGSVRQDLFIGRMAAHANGVGYAPLGESQEDWQQVKYIIHDLDNLFSRCAAFLCVEHIVWNTLIVRKCRFDRSPTCRLVLLSPTSPRDRFLCNPSPAVNVAAKTLES